MERKSSFKYGTLRGRRGFEASRSLTTGQHMPLSLSMTYQISRPLTVVQTGWGRSRSMLHLRCYEYWWGTRSTATTTRSPSRSARSLLTGTECIFSKLRQKAATTLTGFSLRLHTSCCNRQRRRTCRASRTVCRTYRTQLGKTPHKWSRTAVQKSSELWRSKLSSGVLGGSNLNCSLSEFPECPRIRRRSATCRRKCTFGKSFRLTNHQYVWIQVIQAHFSPEDIFTDWKSPSQFWFHHQYMLHVLYVVGHCAFTPPFELHR